MSKKLYLTVPQMKAEIERCLQCPNKPCQKACPVSCSPQEFIAKAKTGDFEGAVQTIGANNPMGQTCGLICPETFCMKACLRQQIDHPISIPKLQATILEKYRKDQKRPEVKANGYTVAIIGAGPAGLAAAEKLSSLGVEVTIFEKGQKIGGALNLIPKTRLPFEVIEKDGQYVLSSDLVKIFYGMTIASPQVLLCNFDAVVVATGEPHCQALNIKGEELVIPYMAYLENPSDYVSQGKIAVIGGGRVAIDCALTAKRQGASEVDMFVRRRLSDMRISSAEYLELIENEIDVTTMTSSKEVEEKDGKFYLYTIHNQFDEGKLVGQENSQIVRGGYDYIIKAIGSHADKFSEDERIFYAGDCKNGGSTIVEALASGQQTAYKVYDFLLGDEKSASV